MTEQAPIMINAEPLKPHLKAVELAERAWAAVGAAYDSAHADKKGDYAEQFQLAEQTFYWACQALAIVVAGQVKDAERAAAE